MSAYDKVIFNPTTNLSHVEQINKAAMADAVRRSNVVLAALSEGSRPRGARLRSRQRVRQESR